MSRGNTRQRRTTSDEQQAGNSPKCRDDQAQGSQQGRQGSFGQKDGNGSMAFTADSTSATPVRGGLRQGQNRHRNFRGRGRRGQYN